MYKSFFGLRENPFNVNPDPRFLHRTPRIQETLEQLTYGVQHRKGLILLTGEVGTGKTTLINYLLDWLHQQKMPTAFIFNSHLSVNHLFDFILNDFGIPVDFRLRSNMLLELNQWLLKRFRDGSAPVLIVDEAQGLSFELLEEIRLLLNLETASEKLLQIVLVGQPELEDKLKRPEMRQLRQRIALRCNTSPLTLAESHGYLADRLRVAGATRTPVFESGAVEALHYYSRGIPRVMNLLCEHALINAYVEELNPVPLQMVEEAARDFLMDEFPPLSIRSGVDNHLDSKLSVMHSTFASESTQSFSSEEACSPQEPVTDWIAVPSACALEEPALLRESGMVTTLPEPETIAASKHSLNGSLSVRDLVPALSGPPLQHGASSNSLDAIACQSDCAGELMATMARILESASSSPRPRIEPPKVKNQPSPTANRTQTAASISRTVSLNSTKPIPSNPGRPWMRGFPSLNAWRGSWGILPWPAIFLATWLRVSAAILAATRQVIRPAKALVGRWVLEFRRDWVAMTDAIAFPRMIQSLVRWFCQPVSSKPMTSSKNQTV